MDTSPTILQRVSDSAALIAVLVALVTLLVTRAYYRRTLSSHLQDRLLDLNRTMLQYPDVAAEFQRQSKGNIDHFRSQPHDKEKAKAYQQLRAYTYLRLNLYEEAFNATQGRWQFGNRKQWQNYIDERMKHHLVRGLFDLSKNQLSNSFVNHVSDHVYLENSAAEPTTASESRSQSSALTIA